ncbi:VOC family protein [Aspergillus affinis]|uniref:VOC family protein n=1 Tax=Aspergillus affinis TaxID=1070780 RepID=UPI0022FF0704|nr:uncharacterized protein KD926_006168 [Aspergillus affinis]KAI9042044.1 hypothetical protein KD926_006168 [Aspergillus affinis]
MFHEGRTHPTLDHIVILVSHKTLSGLSDSLHHLFTVALGGNHADGLTSNKLVLLKDGVYIEFIAFFDSVDPERRKQHRWGNLKENTIIDWAFTFPPKGDFDAIKQRVLNRNSGFHYQEPDGWGRKRNDGTMLEWRLSAPVDSLGNPVPGIIPFWCLDKTPRELRVPFEAQPELTDHPCRAVRVSSLSVTVPHGQSSDIKKVYEAIYDLQSRSQWPYEVPSDRSVGTHCISLLEDVKMVVTLTLSGPERGQVEVLPGLVFNIQ